MSGTITPGPDGPTDGYDNGGYNHTASSELAGVYMRDGKMRQGPLTPTSTADLKKALSPSNFTLAWERLLRAGEPAHKWYWRSSAALSSTIIPTVSRRLRKNLNEGHFHPDHVCIYSHPKPSGLLRHKSILSIGDLLVYQAIVNIVADKVYTRTRDRQGKSVFGNLYAGPKSQYFFIDWRDCYRQFNEANRAAFAEGYRWVAEFDFASFYDSIDHQLLGDLLEKEFQVGSDLVTILKRLLNHWSCAGDNASSRLPRLYLGHGIPQGPQPSPLLAEAVLSYIDTHMHALRGIRYLRYADDIRIWARDKETVRYYMAVLDRLARQIGLFPQTRKTGLQPVDDIEQILKTVSIPWDTPNPKDTEFLGLPDNEKARPSVRLLWEMLQEFAESRQIHDLTKFKYLLGLTRPTSEAAMRLCNLVRERPDLMEPCCRYFERIEHPTQSLIDELIGLTREFSGYPWCTGRLFRVLSTQLQHLNPNGRRTLQGIVRDAVTRTGIKSDCQLQGVARVLSVDLSVHSAPELECWAKSATSPWWSVVHFVLNVNSELYGEAALHGLLQYLLSHNIQEVSRAAAYRLCLLGRPQPNQRLDAHGECSALFKRHGLHGKLDTRKSRLNHLLGELAHSFFPSNDCRKLKIAWRSILHAEHADVEKYAVRLLGEHHGDRDQFILLLDSALEIIFEKLWVYGQCAASTRMSSRDSRGKRLRLPGGLRAQYPDTCRFMISVNDLRNRSELSHARNTWSNSRNRRVHYHDVSKAMQKLPSMLVELAGLHPEG